MPKIRYYPTVEQAMTILDEDLLVNFVRDSLYDVMCVYPCDQRSHFEFEMMNIRTISDYVNEDFLLILEEWHHEMPTFIEHFKLKKGRDIDG